MKSKKTTGKSAKKAAPAPKSKKAILVLKKTASPVASPGKAQPAKTAKKKTVAATKPPAVRSKSSTLKRVRAATKKTGVTAPAAKPKRAALRPRVKTGPGLPPSTVEEQSPLLSVPPILLEGDTPAPPAVYGPGDRYVLGPTAPLTHPLHGEPGELPQAYGTKSLFIAARDPHWLYVSWDLTDDQQMQYNKLAADKHLAVRTYEQVISGKPQVEAPVHPESKNWFVPVNKSGVRYVAQLGYYDSDRQWVVISESKATMTPTDSPAEDATVNFTTLPMEVPFEILLELIKGAAREHLPLATAIQEMTRKPILETVAEFHPSVSFRPKPKEKSVRKALETSREEWTPEQEQALAQLVAIDEVRRVWIGSLEITELVRRHLARELASGAWAQLLTPEKALVELGALGSISSPFGAGKQPGQKGFWFNVNAELIVYGATEPEAEVTIGGRRIQLRKDGSFSYRFALPDGAYELPAVATSADKTDSRVAVLKFSRQTDYQGEVGTHPQDASLKTPSPDHVA